MGALTLSRELADPGERLRRLQLQLRLLAIDAGVGAGIDRLAPALGETWSGLVGSAGPGVARRVSAFVAGACGLVRWLDPARSAHAVPPLAVAWRDVDEQGALWLDLVLPADGRHAAAEAWARDLLRLLAAAGVACHARTVVVTTAAADGGLVLPRHGWGCQSLLARHAAAVGSTA